MLDEKCEIVQKKTTSKIKLKKVVLNTIKLKSYLTWDLIDVNDMKADWLGVMWWENRVEAVTKARLQSAADRVNTIPADLWQTLHKYVLGCQLRDIKKYLIILIDFKIVSLII